MADAPVPSFSRAREEKISELSTFFANDDLSLEELERRIELVYKASNVTELETITADLRSAVARPAGYTAPPPARSSSGRSRAPVIPGAPAARARILTVMSSTRRLGRWALPQKLDVVGIMSDSFIDLTHAVLPPGVVDIDLRLIMTSFKLVIPAGMRVINETHSFMASVHSRDNEMAPSAELPPTGVPVVRLTGFAIMADVKIVVRRGELPVDDDERDD